VAVKLRIAVAAALFFHVALFAAFCVDVKGEAPPVWVCDVTGDVTVCVAR
jgi:hypothetical protein